MVKWDAAVGEEEKTSISTCGGSWFCKNHSQYSVPISTFGQSRVSARLLALRQPFLTPDYSRPRLTPPVPTNMPKLLDGEFKIDAVLGTRGTKRGAEALVRWLGDSHTSDT